MRPNPFLTDSFVQVVQAVYGLAEQDQTITAPVVIAMTGGAQSSVRHTLALLEREGYLASQVTPYVHADGRVQRGVTVRVYTLTGQGRAQVAAADRQAG